MVDRDLLLRKLANLETYLEQLATYRGVLVLPAIREDVEDLTRFRNEVLSLI